MMILKALLAAALFSHLFTQPTSLDGDWDMAYRPYEFPRDVHRLPELSYKMVENAVPAYWEDLFSGEEYRIHPMYHLQTFPISGTAEDMTLPNIYGTFFYKRTVTLDRDDAAVLCFEGVRNQVHVWVNGRFVAFRQGFSTPFEIALPKGTLRKGDNTIVLAVSNGPNLGYCDFVSGMTTRSIYRGTGGINGHLELSFPENDLGDVYVTTAADLKSFTVHVSGTADYRWEIQGVGKGRHKGDLTLSTEGLSFWTPDTPNLHELVITTPAGKFATRFGLRRLTAKGEALQLNGRPIYLRGVTEHGYFPLTVHLPRDLEYYRKITAKRKELGFNFVRFHTFVPPVDYLTACDELGMLVHIESPNFVDIPEYESIIAFARTHPCAVIYCTGNETRIDSIAEAYLEMVADRVHSMSDGLFSPMSALRAMEYQFYDGHDDYVTTPWEHNPGRFARVGRYADLYTTYQNSSTSYKAVNSPLTAAIMDSWGDAYARPRLAHEICIDGTYADLSSETKYPAGSPILKTGLFSGIREMLACKGLLEKADLYYRNSCQWQRRCRKFCFEKIRSMKRTAGYDFLGDIDTHWHTFGYSVGMMNEFYELKYSETRENVLRYNSAAVLLCSLGSDFNFRAGEKKDVAFSISNFEDSAVDGILRLTLCDKKGRSVFSKEIRNLAAPLGEISELGTITVEFPRSKTPAAYLLKAEFSAGKVRASNEWEVYAFPEVRSAGAPDVLTDISRDELLDAMEDGRTVILFGKGPFKSLTASFQCGLPGRSDGNAATVIQPGHPALGKFPHEGFCGWQFRRMMEDAEAVQIEADVPFNPVIDVASAVKCPIRQAFLFEYSVGKGRLLVCSLKFLDSDPAAQYLKSSILSYAASPAFVPRERISAAQLAAIIDAPLVRGGLNTGKQNNVNDATGSVRVPQR